MRTREGLFDKAFGEFVGRIDFTQAAAFPNRAAQRFPRMRGSGQIAVILHLPAAVNFEMATGPNHHARTFMASVVRCA